MCGQRTAASQLSASSQRFQGLNSGWLAGLRTDTLTHWATSLPQGLFLAHGFSSLWWWWGLAFVLALSVWQMQLTREPGKRLSPVNAFLQRSPTC